MIRVELFAAFAEYTGNRKLELEYLDGMTCAQIWSMIVERFPKIGGILPLFAIDDEYVPAETQIRDGQALLLFPPVSGG